MRGEPGKANFLETMNINNFILVLGTEPASSMVADTKLIKDTINYMKQFYEKEKLLIRFPDILRQL